MEACSCLVVSVVPGFVTEPVRVEGREEVDLAPVQQPRDVLVIAVLLTQRPSHHLIVTRTNLNTICTTWLHGRVIINIQKVIYFFSSRNRIDPELRSDLDVMSVMSSCISE